MINCRLKQLGHITDEEEATLKSKEATIEHIGEYANLNLIDEYTDVSENVSEELSDGETECEK